MLCFLTKFGTPTGDANVFSEGTMSSSFAGLLRNSFLVFFYQYSTFGTIRDATAPNKLLAALYWQTNVKPLAVDCC